MNLIKFLLNLMTELMLNTGIGISIVSLWLPPLWPGKAPVTASSTDSQFLLLSLCPKVLSL